MTGFKPSQINKNWSPIYCWTLTHYLETPKTWLWMAKSAFTDNNCQDVNNCQDTIIVRIFVNSIIFLSTLSNQRGTLQGLWSQWMALIRMPVILDCCLWLFWHILWIELSVLFHLLKTQHCYLCPNGRYNLLSPTHLLPPPTPPPPSCLPLSYAIYDDFKVTV